MKHELITSYLKAFQLLLKSATSKLVVLLSFLSYYSQAQSPVPYQWNTVEMGGGGYVPGIVYSKAEPGLVYARTDVGGAYRWNAAKEEWIPLTDMFTDMNNLGVPSLACDPKDANRVYIATGLYTQDWWGSNGAIYRSNDKGTTWTKTDLPFKLGGNDPGRGDGERLQIDPNNTNVLYLGTISAGLWKSTDYGATWNKVTGFPGTKCTFVAIDQSSGLAGEATKDIYVGTFDNLPSSLTASIYKSSDGGKTFSLLAGQPTSLKPKSYEPANVPLPPVALRYAFAGDNIYFTYSNGPSPHGDYRLENNVINGAVYKFNKVTGSWTDVTPALQSQGGYCGIAVHPKDPNIVFVASLARWWPQDDIHVSKDGGATWNTLILNTNVWPYQNKATFDHSKAPYTADRKPHWITTFEIDPFNPENGMFGTGYGIFTTTKLSNALNNLPTHWVFNSKKLEETVPLELISPPTGANLVSALGDIGGFRHDDVTVSPARGAHKPEGGTNRFIAFAENSSNVMVRSHNTGTAYGSISRDGGANWNYFSAQPTGIKGSGPIAVSANATYIVWAAGGVPVSYSTTGGSSWTTSNGIPDGLRPVADRSNDLVFYAYDRGAGVLYKSTDGGANFSIVANDFPVIGQWEGGGALLSVPGKANELWLALGAHGLYHSTDGGQSFQVLKSVSDVGLITTGKAAPNATYPALYIFGVLNEVPGLYRSDNIGASWVKINNSNQEFGRSYTSMTGDPRIYGRLYVGTQGRGILYGDISGTPPTNNNPVAAVTATPVSGIAPLKVAFDASKSTDQDGDALTYHWDFGNGATGTGVAATYTYTVAGVYTAKVTAADGKGGLSSATVKITVSGATNANPQVVVTANPLSGVAPLNTKFDASKSTDADGDALTYSWDFGDGTKDTGAVVSHIYTTAGTYKAVVMATDGKGGSASASVNITVTSGGTSTCNFGAPLATALPSIYKTFNKAHVLGTGGPNLSNVTSFVINWSLQYNGLWQFSFNTNNGQPNWYMDLRTISVSRFTQTKPDIVFNNSGIAGLDGEYWVTIDNGNFAMVSKSGGFTIYFNNSTTPPSCTNSALALAADELINGEDADFVVYPNPGFNYLNISGDMLQNATLRIVDTKGREVYNSGMVSSLNDFTIDISRLNSGVYFLHVIQGDKLKVKKIIKSE